MLAGSPTLTGPDMRMLSAVRSPGGPAPRYCWRASGDSPARATCIGWPAAFVVVTTPSWGAAGAGEAPGAGTVAAASPIPWALFCASSSGGCQPSGTFEGDGTNGRGCTAASSSCASSSWGSAMALQRPLCQRFKALLSAVQVRQRSQRHARGAPRVDGQAAGRVLDERCARATAGGRLCHDAPLAPLAVARVLIVVSGMIQLAEKVPHVVVDALTVDVRFGSLIRLCQDGCARHEPPQDGAAHFSRRPRVRLRHAGVRRLILKKRVLIHPGIAHHRLAVGLGLLQ